MSVNTQSMRAAVAQLCSTTDLRANLDTCKRLAQQSADQGASLLVLPECFAFMGGHEQDKFTVAEILNETNPGTILSCVMEIAQAHNMWVIAGGIPEIRLEDEDIQNPETAYNTSIVVAPDGTVAARYRKIHLFDIDIPGGATFKESASTSPGQDAVVVATSLGKVGLSICYDLRFPELYRKLTLDLGAEILTVPAAFTAHTGAAHWHTLLRARAIENECWVLAAGQSGRHNPKRASYGHSLIIDPWGVVRAEVEAGEGVAVVELDRSFLEEKRTQLPCLEHVVLRHE